MEMVLRLAGTPSIGHITRNHVITRDIASHATTVPHDFLKRRTYIPLAPIRDQSRL